MSMEVKGQSVLAQIAERPSAFGMSVAQINMLVTSTLIGRLKDKATGIITIRSIAGTIGADDFAVTLDHLSDKDAATLAKRLDPKNSSLKTADAAQQRDQIVNLAHGKIEPLAAGAKTPKSVTAAVRTRTPKTGNVMESKALKPRAPRKVKFGA